MDGLSAQKGDNNGNESTVRVKATLVSFMRSSAAMREGLEESEKIFCVFNSLLSLSESVIKS